ncbi:MAG TPA: hypothetical protein VN650_07340 [Gemmatimonadaceae bacterium]|nr:hypothetical protein [Gemmatimonadaceae bacterium]
MPRLKSERHSTDLDAEIARLEQERKRLIQSEDQRRGAIIREFLAGPSGGSLRAILQPLVAGRDSFLFGLDVPSNGTKQAAPRSRQSATRSLVESSSRHSIEAGTSA